MKKCNDCQNEFDNEYDKCPNCGSNNISIIKKNNIFNKLDNYKIVSLLCLLLDLPAIIYGIVRLVITGQEKKTMVLVLFSIIGLTGIVFGFFLKKLVSLDESLHQKEGKNPSLFRSFTAVIATYFIALMPQLLYFVM